MLHEQIVSQKTSDESAKSSFNKTKQKKSSVKFFLSENFPKELKVSAAVIAKSFLLLCVYESKLCNQTNFVR